jgi:hypothetical protein
MDLTYGPTVVYKKLNTKFTTKDPITYQPDHSDLDIYLPYAV